MDSATSFDSIYAKNRTTIIGTNVALVVLSTTAVILRLFSRKLSKVRFWYDDCLIIVALVLSYGVYTCYLVALNYGLGKHVKSVRPYQVSVWLKLLYVTQVLYNVVIGCTKFSVLLFYHRLFPSKRFHKASYMVTALIVAWFLACTTISVIGCLPIHAFWDPQVKRTCVRLKDYYLGNAVANITTDLLLLALPLPMIWSLQLATGRKLMLSGVFLLGLFTSTTSMIRLNYVFKSTSDITYDFESADWTAIEMGVAITTACLPTMGPLVSAVHHLRKSSYKRFERITDGRAPRPNNGEVAGRRIDDVGFTGASDNSKRPLRNAGFYSSTNISAAESGSFDIPMDSIQVRKGVDVGNS